MFSKPEENLKYLDLHANMIVADLGAGTGFYTILLAQMFPSLKIYAFDINPHFLKTIKHKAYDLHLDNIEYIPCDLEEFHSTKLKDNLVDRIVISNIFFQLENKENFIKEVNRILKPNGKILFVDFVPHSQIVTKVKDKVLSKEQVLEFFTKNNFILDKEIFTGEHHYGMILIKK